MGLTKVSNSKSNFQDHSKALKMVPFDRSHTISYWTSIATVSLSSPFLIYYHSFTKIKEVT